MVLGEKAKEATEMETLRDKVAIVGMGCTRFGELWDKSAEDLIVEACYEAFEDAGIEPRDIQAAWLGTAQSGMSGGFLSTPLRLDHVPVTRVENACATATDAFRNAAYAIAAGMYDIVLVCGVEKLKDAGWAGLGLQGLVGTGVGPLITAPAMFAWVAIKYFETFGLNYQTGKETIGKISVKSHHNGSLNPKAHLQREVTLEQVVNAPIIAWPLGLYDCCGVSDGAAVAIITRPELARRLRDDYVLLKALSLDTGSGQELDLIHIEESVVASKKAYEQAGIKDPYGELDLAIVHDCFSISELLIYEDLGFCPKGAAREYVDSGAFTVEGELPVNTDGGLKCFGHPIGASGLRMMYEVYKQLQGKSGARQLKKADLGLTRNLGGFIWAATCSVAILGRRD